MNLFRSFPSTDFFEMLYHIAYITFDKNLFRQHKARYRQHNHYLEERDRLFCCCHFQAAIFLWRVGWIKIWIENVFIHSLKSYDYKLTFDYQIFRQWSLFDLRWSLIHVHCVLDSNWPIDATGRSWIRQQYPELMHHQWYKLHPMFQLLNKTKFQG